MSQLKEPNTRVSRRAAIKWGAGVAGAGAGAVVAGKLGLYQDIGAWGRSIFNQLTSVSIAPDATPTTPRPTKPTITVFPQIIPGYTSLAAGHDGNIWFTGDIYIGRVTPAGVFTKFPIGNFNRSPESGSIIAGPDGNLWYTDRGDGNVPQAIGRITPSGHVTEFPLPGGVNGAPPNSMAAGPDGNIWYARGELGDPRFTWAIGRITPHGSIWEETLPDANGQLFDVGNLIAGPDGNMWGIRSSRVGRSFTDAVIRITPAGAITQFPRPISILDFIVGPDHDLWYTRDATRQSQTGIVGRLTPRGAITEYSVPTHSNASLVIGPDGNLWFIGIRGTGNDSNAIGRITPSGASSIFPIEIKNGGLDTLAAGPDGNLWFSIAYYQLGPQGQPQSASSGAIGWITPAGAISMLPTKLSGTPSDQAFVRDGHHNLWFAISPDNVSSSGSSSTVMPTSQIGVITFPS